MSKRKICISWLFFVYFIVLFAERIQSIVRVITNTQTLFASPFNSYVNVFTILSLAAAVIMLIGFNGEFWKSLVGRGNGADYKILSITAGVELLAGMVHTEYTIAPVQFGAYGALILAMALETYANAKGNGKPFITWYNFIYLTAFSMAIPVMYQAWMDLQTVFHIIEAVTAVVLVFAFTYMLVLMFTNRGEKLMITWPIIIAAVGDAVIIGMRWNNEPNIFAMIFVILSVILFMGGKVIQAVISKRTK